MTDHLNPEGRPAEAGEPEVTEGAAPAAAGSAGGDAGTPVTGTGSAGGDAGASAAGGAPRQPHHSYDEGGPGASAEPGGEDEFDHPNSDPEDESEGEALAAEDALAVSYLADLQRLQAEYVNYKKRVDRDREVIRNGAVSGFVESLLPVLDDIYMARQAGDLESGPFAAIAEKLEAILERQGVVRVGAAGEEFDPNVHEALMHVEADLPEGSTGTTVVQVLQPGYRNGERLVRAARVSVADPA